PVEAEEIRSFAKQNSQTLGEEKLEIIDAILDRATLASLMENEAYATRALQAAHHLAHNS
ncbi:MAG: hypothetical protein AAF438_20245, partial [Pseudomonadota bacterium]